MVYEQPGVLRWLPTRATLTQATATTPTRKRKSRSTVFLMVVFVTSSLLVQQVTAAKGRSEDMARDVFELSAEIDLRQSWDSYLQRLKRDHDPQDPPSPPPLSLQEQAEAQQPAQLAQPVQPTTSQTRNNFEEVKNKRLSHPLVGSSSPQRRNEKERATSDSDISPKTGSVGTTGQTRQTGSRGQTVERAEVTTGVEADLFRQQRQGLKKEEREISRQKRHEDKAETKELSSSKHVDEQLSLSRQKRHPMDSDTQEQSRQKRHVAKELAMSKHLEEELALSRQKRHQIHSDYLELSRKKRHSEKIAETELSRHKRNEVENILEQELALSRQKRHPITNEEQELSRQKRHEQKHEDDELSRKKRHSDKVIEPELLRQKRTEGEESLVDKQLSRKMRRDTRQQMQINSPEHDVELQRMKRGEVELQREKRDEVELQREKRNEVELHREKRDEVELQREKRGEVELQREKRGEVELQREKRGEVELQREKRDAVVEEPDANSQGPASIDQNPEKDLSRQKREENAAHQDTPSITGRRLLAVSEPEPWNDYATIVKPNPVVPKPTRKPSPPPRPPVVDIGKKEAEPKAKKSEPVPKKSEPEHFNYHKDLLTRRLKEVKLENKRRKRGKAVEDFEVDDEDDWDHELRLRRDLAAKAIEVGIAAKKERQLHPPPAAEMSILQRIRHDAEMIIKRRQEEQLKAAGGVPVPDNPPLTGASTPGDHAQAGTDQNPGATKPKEAASLAQKDHDREEEPPLTASLGMDMAEEDEEEALSLKDRQRDSKIMRGLLKLPLMSAAAAAETPIRGFLAGKGGPALVSYSTAATPALSPADTILRFQAAKASRAKGAKGRKGRRKKKRGHK